MPRDVGTDALRPADVADARPPADAAAVPDLKLDGARDGGADAGRDGQPPPGRTVVPLDEQTLCTVGGDRQPQMYACQWNDGSALCAVQVARRTDYAASGVSCCLDHLEAAPAQRSADFDATQDLPPYSFFKQLLIPAFIGGQRQLVTHVHQGGVSQPQLNLSLWREQPAGSCTLARAPGQPFSYGNTAFVEPAVGGVGSRIFGAFSDGTSAVQSASIEPGVPAPAWSPPALVRDGCPAQGAVLQACEAAAGASYRAMLASCGASLVLLRTADGRTFEEVRIPFSKFTHGGPGAGTLSCLTKDGSFYLVWPVTQGMQQTFYFNQLSDGTGPWDTQGFADSPVILSVTLPSQRETVFLTKFWPAGGNYWAAFTQRLGSGEPQTGSAVYFGRSQGGGGWVFDIDDRCAGSRCQIPDFVIVDQGYFYVHTTLTDVMRSQLRADFRYNLQDGDPRAPIDAGRSIGGMVDVNLDDHRVHYHLHQQGEVIGFIYWTDWESLDPFKSPGPDARLQLQRFRIE